MPDRILPAPEPLLLQPRVAIVALAGETEQLAITLACLGSYDDVVLLASDDQALREFAASGALTARFVLPNELAPQRYWCELLAAAEFDGAPTIFLRAGTTVPDSFVQRMASALQRNPDAAAVCPMGAVHPLLRVFAEPRPEVGLDVEQVDQWLNDYARGREFDTPVLLESCALLRGDSWRHTRDYADDSALFRAVSFSRQWMLACDHLYVDDAAVPSMGASAEALPLAQRRALGEPHPGLTWRHALSELAGRSEAPQKVEPCKPVQLHLGHSWGGGLGRWIEDYVEADTHHTNLVLRPLGDWEGFGKTIALYRGADMDVPLRSWTLTNPILSLATESAEYQSLLREIVRDFRVEHLIISSLIGSSLDVLLTGLPTTYVAHDFFPYCPALVAAWKSPCTQCDSARQRECRQDNPHHRFFLHNDDDHWDRVRALFAEYFALPHIQMVAPSQSVADRYRELVPGCAHRDIKVIPHGLGPALVELLEPVRQAPREQHERLKVVVLGSLASQKGVDILAEIMEPLTQFADLFLIGCGEEGRQFEGREHVVVVPRYTREELPQHLVNASTDVGLLLSVVPETFSYTLSEFWAAGIPVVATRLGAFADRVENDANGWLVEPTPEAVFNRVQQLALDRGLIERSRTLLADSDIRTTAQMTDEYAACDHLDPVPPVTRFVLGRRSYRNAYRDYQEVRAIHINHKATYNEILLEFLAYSRQKLTQSERGSAWKRKLTQRFLDRWISWLKQRQ